MEKSCGINYFELEKKDLERRKKGGAENKKHAVSRKGKHEAIKKGGLQKINRSFDRKDTSSSLSFM